MDVSICELGGIGEDFGSGVADGGEVCGGEFVGTGVPYFGRVGFGIDSPEAGHDAAIPVSKS